MWHQTEFLVVFYPNEVSITLFILGSIFVVAVDPQIALFVVLTVCNMSSAVPTVCVCLRIQ